MCVIILHCRIIVGAPFGTFPGGLSLSSIPGEVAESRTGLVYSCPVKPGICEGVRGNTSIHVGIASSLPARDLPIGDLPDDGAFIEGRLFDQARKKFLFISNAVFVQVPLTCPLPANQECILWACPLKADWPLNWGKSDCIAYLCVLCLLAATYHKFLMSSFHQDRMSLIVLCRY